MDFECPIGFSESRLRIDAMPEAWPQAAVQGFGGGLALKLWAELRFFVGQMETAHCGKAVRRWRVGDGF
jgi:hypothetical protein